MAEIYLGLSCLGLTQLFETGDLLKLKTFSFHLFKYFFSSPSFSSLSVTHYINTGLLFFFLLNFPWIGETLISMKLFLVIVFKISVRFLEKEIISKWIILSWLSYDRLYFIKCETVIYLPPPRKKNFKDINEYIEKQRKQ